MGGVLQSNYCYHKNSQNNDSFQVNPNKSIKPQTIKKKGRECYNGCKKHITIDNNQEIAFHSSTRNNTKSQQKKQKKYRHKKWER